MSNPKGSNDQKESEAEKKVFDQLKRNKIIQISTPGVMPGTAAENLSVDMPEMTPGVMPESLPMEGELQEPKSK